MAQPPASIAYRRRALPGGGIYTGQSPALLSIELGLPDQSHGDQGQHNEDRPKKPTRDVRIKRCYYPSELVLLWRGLLEHNRLLRLIWILRPIRLNGTEWFHPEAPDAQAAKAAAAVQFELDDVQRNRIMVQELG